jgi:hypothetical protein
MPRILDRIADTVVYIYGSLDDAKEGARYGGSGFLVSVPLPVNQDWQEIYIVTNRHVIRKARTPVVRFNRLDGGVEYLPTTDDEWMFHSDGDDVAILPFPTADPHQLKLSTVPENMLITPMIVNKHDIGIGDETNKRSENAMAGSDLNTSSGGFFSNSPIFLLNCGAVKRGRRDLPVHCSFRCPRSVNSMFSSAPSH